MLSQSSPFKKKKKDVRECGSWERGREESTYLEIRMLFNFVHIA